MRRLTRALVGILVVTAMLLGAVAIAQGATTLTLTSTRSSVVYPQMTWLKLLSADGTMPVAARVMIQYRPIGTATWRNLRAISASRTAEGTVTIPVGPVILRSITGFRAVATGLESEVTTVAVKARLSRPVAPRVIRAKRYVTVRGFIWPRHAVGTRPVEVTVWKWDGTTWVEMAKLHPKIVGRVLNGAKWQFKRWVSADDVGRWRLQVSHEDTAHAASVSPFGYIKVKAR